MEFRVDDEHHGCDTSERPSPAWITPLQPDVEAGVNVEMDARPFVQSRFYGRAINVHSCRFADVGELSLPALSHHGDSREYHLCVIPGQNNRADKRMAECRSWR